MEHVEAKRFVVIAPTGRSGSVLNQTALLNNQYVGGPECFIKLSKSDFNLSGDFIKSNKEICLEQLSENTSLWVHESRVSYFEFESHFNCSCQRENSLVSLLHVHNLFYDPAQFTIVSKWLRKNPNVKIIVNTRPWQQIVPSRMKSHPIQSGSYLVDAAYWLLIEDRAKINSLFLQVFNQVYFQNLLDLHSDPIKELKSQFQWIGIENAEVQTDLNVRGELWTGGISNSAFSISHMDKLNLVKADKLWLSLSLELSSLNILILGRFVKFWILLAADIAAISRAIKFFCFRLLSNRRTCSGCQITKYKMELRWSKNVINYFRHVVHSRESNLGVYVYLRARRDWPSLFASRTQFVVSRIGAYLRDY